MLSNEEKKAIEYLKRHILPYYDKNGTIEFMLNDTILNLIEKQSKEIEELKENIRKRVTYCNELEKDLFENCSNYVVSKDKIKAKIEEYKKQIEKMEKDDVGIGFTLGKEWSDLKAKIEFGQSLLEKEE